MKNITDTKVYHTGVRGGNRMVKTMGNLHIYGSQAVMSCMHGKHVNKIILFKWMLFNWCKRSKIKFISVTRVPIGTQKKGHTHILCRNLRADTHTERDSNTAFMKWALFHFVNYIKINFANIKCIECVCVFVCVM